jgi:hypothetical protein
MGWLDLYWVQVQPAASLRVVIRGADALARVGAPPFRRRPVLADATRHRHGVIHAFERAESPNSDPPKWAGPFAAR